jgi:murein DD-endopeptidase
MKWDLTAVLVVCLCFLGAPGAGQVSVQAEKRPQYPAKNSSEFSPVDVRVPIPPTPVMSVGKAYLAYELIITNFQARDLTLTAVEVFNGVFMIADYRNEKLTNALYRPGIPRDPSDRRDIGPGMSAIAFIWLTMDPATIPSALHHRLTFRVLDPNGNGVDTIVESRQVEVRKDRPLVLPPPFEGGTWAAGNGASSTSIHRRAFTVIDGGMRMPQRFAVDWFKLGDRGRGEDDAKLVHDDPRKNENWYGYGAEVVAVASGIVSAIKDGIPDNVPLAKSRAVPITLETIAGNYVFLDLEDGHFALFAHLQPGSLRVKVGDKVRRGQILGRLGDSGNSDSPHLHFHIVDGNTPLGAEGLPFVFESYELLGVLKDLGVLTRDDGWRPQPSTAVEKCSKEMPLENMVIRFP